MPARPLIAHAVHRLDIGGMENGLVNLINGLPEGFADHAVIAFTEISADFARRIRRPGVRLLALHKPPGQTARILPQLWRELRRLRPSIFHTRNLATLEGQTAAWLAGVPRRVHGEHGWDVGDLDGSSPGPLRLRRCLRPLVHHQVALSEPIRRYLTTRVGVADTRVSRICNGVDTVRFAPCADRVAARTRLAGDALPGDAFVIGAVGRLAAVKNLPMLVEAVALAGKQDARFRERARLALVGDGPQRAELEALVATRGLAERTWFAGARDDIPECLGLLDALCLPSLAEGISNTVLEAMACGVPVLATAVGGNAELVEEGVSGWLVASGDAPALADRLLRCFALPEALREAGRAARARAVTQFSLAAMLDGYHAMYAGMLAQPD
ncbi:MAG: TIGR03088 family PEP-CTERM/XrtA system glycosyltransferase [Betaproteobacteria bacterium]|nr:TIGR03088 family PEP-CTERM/XrtA system glycosyltransferase [Betaproteobacteria bacterium]